MRRKRSSPCIISAVFLASAGAAPLPEGRLACRRQHEVLLAPGPFGLCAAPWYLWQPADDAGTAEQRPGRRAPPDGSPDAGEWPPRPADGAVPTRHQHSHHAWPIAPNLLDQDFSADGPGQKGAATSRVSGPRRLAASGGGHRPVRTTRRRLAMADRLHRELALVALRKALLIRPRPQG